MSCKQTYIGSIQCFHIFKYASLRDWVGGETMVGGGVMFTNVHLKKQNMHENAFQFVPGIYLNMPLMFKIYRHGCARAPFSDGCLFEMLLAFKVCFFLVGWFSCCGFSREHSAFCSWFVCLILSISWRFIDSQNTAQRKRTEVSFLFFLKTFSPQFEFKNSDNWTTWKKQIEDNERWPIHTGVNMFTFIPTRRGIPL